MASESAKGGKPKVKKRDYLKVEKLRKLEPGKYLHDHWEHGCGSFEARHTGVAIRFYYRYARDRIAIGAWSESGVNGISLKDARRQAEALSRRYVDGATKLRQVLETEAATAADEAKRAAEAAADEAKRAAEAIELERARKSLTVGVLLSEYVTALRTAKKPSAAQVERAMNRNIREPFPDIWSLPARDAQADDLMPVLDRITIAQKPREAAKMRSYLRAAFSMAVEARTTMGASKALRDLGIQSNPLRNVSTITNENPPRDRALSVAELRAYFAALDALPASDRALLRFHLLTGAQRVEQLSRCLMADVDTDAATILLMDIKGKRKKKGPRRHIVPLIPEALECIAQMSPLRVGQFVFTVTQGESGCGYHSLRNRISAVSAELLAANLTTAPFTAGDLRHTVETRLAGLGVPKEVRAHLQSHGLGGVQQKYQHYDYMKEMRAALERLHRLAGEKQATVTSIKGRARR